MAAVSNQDATLTAAWFESIRDPMLLCNRSLVVIAANRAASELLEIAAGELLQRKVDEILRPIGLAPIFRGPADLQWRCELPAGKGDRRTLDVSGVPFHDRATGAEGWAVSCRSLPAAPEFIGRSAAAQSLRDTVSLLAASHATSILLLGESGAGKELIAKRIHALSKRAAAPLIPINCAALPEALLECELFGYQKGAFTGAQQTKEGLLEAAHGGTVLLDEISELPFGLQAKLLRVLEDHTFRRVGGSHDIWVDIRVIAATNADLGKAIEERRLRTDLYYRLGGVQIQVPPLRERLEDLPELASFFIDRFNRQYYRQIGGLHPVARLLLERHDWPGNVRELRNVIERAVLIESSLLITAESLALQNDFGRNTRTAALAPEIRPPARFCLHHGEKELIAAALAEAGNNQSRAAALLGIGRFGLRYKMKKLGMLRAS